MRRSGGGASNRAFLLVILFNGILRASTFRPAAQCMPSWTSASRSASVVQCFSSSRRRLSLELYADSPVAQGSRDQLGTLFDTLHKSRELGNKGEVLQVTNEIMERAADLSPKHCTMLVSALGAVGLGQHTVSALEAMKARGLQLNKVTYGAVVNACSSAQDVATAKKVMQEMREDGFVPDAMEYSSLLHALKRLNRTDECIACFKEMVDSGVRPTTRTYDGLLGALAAAERWEEFRAFMAEMRSHRVAFSAITYAMAMRCADRTQDTAWVLSLHKDMVSEGLSPSGTMANSVIKAALAVGDLETAAATVLTLLREGGTVVRSVYLNMLERLLAEGQLVALKGVMAEAQALRGPDFNCHDVAACNAVISNSVRRRRADLGRVFLELMGELGLETNDVSFNILMDAALKAKRPHRVWELLREMRTRGIQPGLITYNIMLNACAMETDGAELAVDVWRDFKASGLWPDRILYLSLMRAMAPWTVERETVFALLDDAEGGKIPLDTQMANYALRLLAGSKELDGVEAMLQRMKDRGVERDVVSWTTAIKACQEANDWAKALHFLARMELEGVEPNEITYATTIHVLGQAGRWEEAIKVLDRMEAKGLRNVVAFTSAMAACEMGQAYEEGLRTWKRMLKAGVKVTLPAIDVVLKICLKAGDEDMAAQVLEKSMDWGLLGRTTHARRVLRFIEAVKGRQAMISYVEGLFRSGKLGQLRDESRYVMVEALCDLGLVRHALHLLRNPLPTRKEVKHPLFSQVIAAAAQGGAPDLVFSVHDEMLQDGIAFGKDVYQAVLMALKQPLPAKGSAVVKGLRQRRASLVSELLVISRNGTVAAGNEVLAACVGAKEWDLGTMALVEMAKRRMAFDMQTYQHAIAILAEKREGPRAVQLLREMEARGFAPRTAEYNHAMLACLDKHWETALELFREVQQAGSGVNMDTGTIMAALGACRASKDVKLVPAILQVAQGNGLAPSLVVYNGILSVYAAAQQVDKVIEVLEEMRTLGIKADEFTYNTAIGAFAKVGDYRQALRWLSMMGLEGVTATTVTYNCVIDACANGGNPAKAAEIFQEMKERKVAVDQVTYGSLANAFAKCGQWESAVRVLEEMRRHSSVRPNNFVYCSVMSACNRANQWSVALALLDQLLKEDGMEPDLYTCNEALNACARGGMWERALDILALARRVGITPDTISFNKALQACIAARRWDEARSLIKRMSVEKVPYDRTTHNLIEEISIAQGSPSGLGDFEDELKSLWEENL